MLEKQGSHRSIDQLEEKPQTKDNVQVLDFSQKDNAQGNPKITEIYTQLSNYLDNLSNKFNEAKEKHQADFLIAYRNHMAKVKRELQELKQKSEDQERQINQNDRLSNMEMQLTWFREESIKLYQKVEGKNKENYELKFRLQELDKEKQFLEGQVKALMKKNRLLEVYIYNQENDPEKLRGQSADGGKKQQAPEIDHTFYTATTSNQQERIRSKIKGRVDEEGQGLFTSIHFAPIQSIVQKYLPPDQDATGITLELTSYTRIIETQREKMYKQIQTKLQSVVRQSNKTNMVRSDLENFFLDCVETVRRQIMKRKPPQMRDPQRILRDIKDYSVFRSEDKLKILELLLTHEKLLVFLYQKIFPSNFSTYVQSFTNGLGAQNNDQAINIVAQAFQEKSLDMVRLGFEDFKSEEIVLPGDSLNITRTQIAPNKEQRSQSLKVSDKLMVKKGKLIFKPF